MAGFGGVLLGGVAQGVEAGQKLDLQKSELGIRSRLADIQQQEADQKGQANKQALFKDMLDRSATALNDATALWEKLVTAAPDKSAPQLLEAGKIIRGQIEQTSTGLAQIPGGMNVGQSALKKFDAITAGLPSAVEAATTKGQASGAEAVAAAPGQTAADVFKTKALGPVNAQNAALTATATAPIAVQQAADTARAVGPINNANTVALQQSLGPVNATNAALQATALGPVDAANAALKAATTGPVDAQNAALKSQATLPTDVARAGQEANAKLPAEQALAGYRQSLQQTQNTVQNEAKLRDDFNNSPVVKNFREALTAYNGIVDASTRKSRASDLNMVYGIAKLFDPGSVVREGEQVLVRDTAGLSQNVLGAIQSLNGGAALTEKTRQALLAEAKGRVSQQDATYQAFKQQMTDIATRSGVDPRNIVVDVNRSVGAGAGQGATQPLTAVNPQTGDRIQSLDGGKTWAPVR